MKKICCVLILIMWGLVACGGGSGDSTSGDGNTMRTLALDETVSDTIYDPNGAVDVDWYEFNAVEANRTMVVTVSSAYTNSPVDFMLTIYEKDANGNLVTIFGQSAPEDGHAAANLQIKVGVREPKRYYFAVRDFNDDDSSDQIQYRIRVTFSDEVTENDTFADAIPMAVGNQQVCHDDESIFPKGDLDVYSFNVATAGVYRINAQYDVSENTPMPVNLGLSLYDTSGQTIYAFKGQRPVNNTYVALANLEAGSYYMVVDDQGRDDESQYTYSLCIEPSETDERVENDIQDNAESRDEGAEGYNLDGTLEYFQDEDWYAVPTPGASGATTSQNLRISFHNDFGGTVPEILNGQVDPGSYRIEVRDLNGNVLHSHDHSVAATAAYNVEIATSESATHYLVVKPIFTQQMLVEMPYQLRVQVVEVSDPDEADDPKTLNPNGETVTGKIYKLGDVDDFSITVDTTTGPKVLEVQFDTEEPSEVAYNLHVMYDGKHPILKDINGTEDGTHFKASYYLPQTSGSNTTVDLKVSDDQNNDGADVEYTLAVDVLSIPTAVSPSAWESGNGAAGAVYFDEIGEKADTTGVDVTVIEYDNHNQPEFKANTTLLKAGAPDGNSEWQSQWITGFVDYDNDRDIFKLDLDAMTDGLDVWFCDIQVRMFAAGSPVEYSWALFRDRNPANNVLLERTFWDDRDGQTLQYDEGAEGVIAYQGDSDLAVQDVDFTIPTDLASPADDERLWLGHVWGDSNFYISVQDFNRALMSKEYNSTAEGYDYVANQTPDNDWGNTGSTPDAVRPYYFQVTVKLHPNCSHPTDNSAGCTP